MSDDTKVQFERVNALLACIRGPNGRGEIRLLCDPSKDSVPVRLVGRIEAKSFDQITFSTLSEDIVFNEPIGLTFEKAVEKIKKQLQGETL
jgi:hypothetical protein